CVRDYDGYYDYW
nr:immunoglobulin heavy chain junction region [Mus musculus]